MKTILFCLVLFTGLALLWIYRKYHKRTVTLDYRYKFYALRDKLRLSAINGEINSDNWVFDYIDSTISRLISKLNDIDLFEIMWLSEKNRNNQRLNTFKGNLMLELEKNESMQLIFNELNMIILQYVRQKHISIRDTVSFVRYLKRKIIAIQRALKWLKIRSTNLVFYPETSTAHRFC